MNFTRILGKIFAGIRIVKSEIQPSFSQAGEDQIIRYIIYNLLHIKNPTYLDIGTNHPYIGNNTFYFYNRGSSGVCVEPDKQFAPLIKKYRKRDTLLQIGVAAEDNSKGVMYAFPGIYSGWNTFSKEEAINRQRESGLSYTKIENIELENINNIIAKHFDPYPDIISLDVEGLDLSILKSLDFTRFKPQIICVETITFSVTNDPEKITEISDLLLSKGYIIFADTHINTIFCKADALKNQHI